MKQMTIKPISNRPTHLKFYNKTSEFNVKKRCLIECLLFYKVESFLELYIYTSWLFPLGWSYFSKQTLNEMKYNDECDIF